MRNNKRGQTGGFMDLLVAVAITAIVVLTMILVVATYKAQNIPVTQVASESYLAKTYFSPEMLLLEENGIIHFGVIDLEKFQDPLDIRNQYVNQQKTTIGAKLTIVDIQGNILAGPIYNNEEYFDEKESFARAGVRTADSATLSEASYPVTLSDGRSGILQVVMVVANNE